MAPPDHEHSPPEYGVSTHYIGNKGKDYFANRLTMPMDHLARLQARIFQPFITSDDTVLDFGCGTGNILAALDCKNRIGVEIADEPASIARQRGIEVVSATSAVPSGSIDVVISHHALEHVPYPIGVLKEAKRILKPTGRLVVVVPAESPRARQAWNPNDMPHHLYTWTTQLMGNMLTEAGFEVTPASVCLREYRVPRQLLPYEDKIPGTVMAIVAYLFAKVRRHKELVAVGKPAVVLAE